MRAGRWLTDGGGSDKNGGGPGGHHRDRRGVAVDRRVKGGGRRASGQKGDLGRRKAAATRETGRVQAECLKRTRASENEGTPETSGLRGRAHLPLSDVEGRDRWAVVLDDTAVGSPTEDGVVGKMGAPPASDLPCFTGLRVCTRLGRVSGERRGGERGASHIPRRVATLGGMGVDRRHEAPPVPGGVGKVRQSGSTGRRRSARRRGRGTSSSSLQARGAEEICLRVGGGRGETRGAASEFRRGRKKKATKIGRGRSLEWETGGRRTSCGICTMYGVRRELGRSRYAGGCSW